MKKYLIKGLSLLMVLMLGLSLAACGGSNGSGANNGTADEGTPAADKTLWEQVQEKGVITVGNSPDYEPYEFEDGKGGVIGFDIDLLGLICEELGIKYELVNMSFDNIITAVQNGQVNIGMSGFSITPERAEQVDFTVPYFSSAQAVVVNPDSEIKALADLTGKKITAGMGTTGETAAKENIENAEVIGLDNYAAAFMQLKNKGCDAVVADLPVAKKFAEKDGFVILSEYLSSEDNAIVVQKGNEDLVEAFNGAIEKLKAEGKIDELVEKWMVTE